MVPGNWPNLIFWEGGNKGGKERRKKECGKESDLGRERRHMTITHVHSSDSLINQIPECISFGQSQLEFRKI
jgi:hypothetical protein